MQAFPAQSGRELLSAEAGGQVVVIRLALFSTKRGLSLAWFFCFDASGTQCPCYRQIVHERRLAQGFLLSL